MRAWDLRDLLYYIFLVHLGQISGIFVLILETKDSDGGEVFSLETRGERKTLVGRGEGLGT